MAILPFLTAESDVKCAATKSLARCHIRSCLPNLAPWLLTRCCRDAFIKSKMLENEAELMKGVPDWEAGASVYKTTYMKPMDVFGVRP